MPTTEIMETNSAVDSSSILIFEDWLQLNPFGYSDIDQAVQAVFNMVKAVNRTSIYFAYTMGRFVDVKQLKQRYKINSVSELAKKLQTSPNTLLRYRAIHDLLTPYEVKKLADRGISINAVLVIANARKDHPVEAKQLLESLLTGSEAVLAKDVDSALTKLVEENARTYQLLPGGEPPTDEADEHTLQQLTRDDRGEEEKSVADDIIDAEIESNPSATVEDDNDEDEEDAKERKTSAANAPKTLATQTCKDLTPLIRDLASIVDNLEEQLEVAFKREDVIIGDKEADDMYRDKLDALYYKLTIAGNTIIKVFNEGKKHGYVNEQTKLILPESAIVEDLFRQED